MAEGAGEAEEVSNCLDFKKSAKSRSNRLVFPKGRDQAKGLGTQKGFRE